MNPNDKIVKVHDQQDIFHGQYLWWCLGCEQYHGVWIDAPNELTGAHWHYNSNPESPTFAPSILTEWDEGPENLHRRCHVFINDGHIQYLGDCTHALAGQSVPMQNIRETMFYRDTEA